MTILTTHTRILVERQMLCRYVVLLTVSSPDIEHFEVFNNLLKENSRSFYNSDLQCNHMDIFEFYLENRNQANVNVCSLGIPGLESCLPILEKGLGVADLDLFQKCQQLIWMAGNN